MAFDPEYVRDWITQARAQFPDTLATVVNSASYDFEPKTTKNGKDTAMLCIRLYEDKNTKDRMPLWTTRIESLGFVLLLGVQVRIENVRRDFPAR